MVDIAVNFGGSIPEYYDSIMGPAQFEPFGAEPVRRVAERPPRRCAGNCLRNGARHPAVAGAPASGDPPGGLGHQRRDARLRARERFRRN